MQRLFGWGLVLWLLALLGAAVEIAAQQSPDSGVHLGVPVGPIALFKQQCAFFGVVLALVELRGHHVSRALSLTLLAGVGSAVVAQGVAAGLGFYAVTPTDFRPAAQAVFWLRAAGHGTLGACLLWIMRREWRSEAVGETR